MTIDATETALHRMQRIAELEAGIRQAVEAIDDTPSYSDLCKTALSVKNKLKTLIENAPDKRALDFTTMRDINVHRCETVFKHRLGDWSELEWAGAAAGEAGEVLEVLLDAMKHGLLAANVAKKISRDRIGASGNKKTREEYMADLAGEVAGMILYWDLGLAMLEIDLGEAVRAEFNRKSEELGADIRM